MLGFLPRIIIPTRIISPEKNYYKDLFYQTLSFMPHLSPLIVDLGLILGAGAIMTLLFKKLKQPVVLGYLLAGVLVGPNFSLFPTITDQKDIEVLAEIGVIFLLFSLGLEFSFKKLLKVGAAASVTAIVKVLFMLLLGYLVGMLLGWSSMDSIFLGGILSISSTTIIIRAFEELGVKGQKFANLVFGILVVEDIVAVVLLVLIIDVWCDPPFCRPGNADFNSETHFLSCTLVRSRHLFSAFVAENGEKVSE